MQSWNAIFFLFFFIRYGRWGVISGRVRALNLTVPLGSGRVGSDDLGYGPGSGFSFEPVQTSTQNTLRPDHPESGIFGLIYTKWRQSCFVLYTVLYIYICNHVLNWNIFKNCYFSTITLHCWFAQQSRLSLTKENITKTTLLDGEFVIKHTLLDGEFVIKHTLLDGEFVINTCLLWWRSSTLATTYDDVTVTKWRLISCFHP